MATFVNAPRRFTYPRRDSRFQGIGTHPEDFRYRHQRHLVRWIALLPGALGLHTRYIPVSSSTTPSRWSRPMILD